MDPEKVKFRLILLERVNERTSIFHLADPYCTKCNLGPRVVLSHPGDILVEKVGSHLHSFHMDRGSPYNRIS